MRYYSIKMFGILLSVLVFCGCPSVQPKDEKEVARKPEIILYIASMNLGSFNKRIERKKVIELAKVLKREQVEVLAVQGISRYPDVASRVDFVNELSTQTDWRNAFGEMMNISGRQTGNAVFSSYPIISQHNQTFDHLKTVGFEAALQATIDAGVRSLVVVSVQMPPKATAEEEAQCMRLITASNPDASSQTTVITGNLSSLEAVRSSYSFTEVPRSESVRGTTPNVWYSASTSFQLIASHIVETELGKLVIAQLGIFRQK
jgi:endonuclease/exonuclease/phosphatase family metal-dependent hydrolase